MDRRFHCILMISYRYRSILPGSSIIQFACIWSCAPFQAACRSSTDCRQSDLTEPIIIASLCFVSKSKIKYSRSEAIVTYTWDLSATSFDFLRLPNDLVIFHKISSQLTLSLNAKFLNSHLAYILN